VPAVTADASVDVRVNSRSPLRQHVGFKCNGSSAACDRRYDHVTFAATHNSFARFGQFSRPNQLRTIPERLAMGIRGLMLDVYRAYGELRLCHEECDSPSGYISFAHTLADIKRFLDAERHEIVTLIFQSQVPPRELATAFSGAGLLPYLYDHNGTAWPTLRQMIGANRRLVVFVSNLSSEDGGLFPPPANELGPTGAHRDYRWLHSEWRLASENPYSYASRASFGAGHPAYCAVERGSGEGLFILNHFISPASYVTASEVNGIESLVGGARYCRRKRGRWPNCLVVDYENCDSQHTCGIARGHSGVPDVVRAAAVINESLFDGDR
jgi:hypothetical protein